MSGLTGGRPPKEDEPRTEMLSLRLTPTMKARLAPWREAGTLSDLILSLLGAYLALDPPTGKVEPWTIKTAATWQKPRKPPEDGE